MKTRCEVVVNQVLPAIRAMLARNLARRHKLTQIEIAEKLGITQAAVSKYLSSSGSTCKAEKILKERGLTEDIHDFSDFIASEEPAESRIVRKFCDLCDSMSQEGIPCDLYAEIAPYLREENCDFCLVRDTRT